jgi:hypothetical protein
MVRTRNASRKNTQNGGSSTEPPADPGPASVLTATKPGKKIGMDTPPATELLLATTKTARTATTKAKRSRNAEDIPVKGPGPTKKAKPTTTQALDSPVRSVND